MKQFYRILLILRAILKNITIILLPFICTIVIFIMIHLCTNGYVDWNHFMFDLLSKHRKYEIISINTFITGYCILFVPIILIVCIFTLPEDALPKCYDQKYSRKFLQKFVILYHVPEIEDINESFSRIMQNKIFKNILDEILLVPLIVKKINIIRKMNVSEKYELFYKQNIQGLNIGLLSTYNTSSSEIQKLLKEIYFPKLYIFYNNIYERKTK